jgi:hypothetical protein
MSEEVAAAIGTIEYWQRRAEQAEADAAALRQAAEIVRSEYSKLLEAPLPDVYAVMKWLRWPVGHLALSAEVHKVGAALLTELAMLRELRDDVQRWREGGGDVRDLHYVLETLEKARSE